jgi:prolyl-tRNA editing enzyme YbaK/EbsC (Cys-tRNA(Pro) deacylase)
MKTIFTLLALAVLTGQLHSQVVFNLSSSPGVGSDPRSVSVTDVNGDGKTDLISANGQNNSLTVLTNDGSGRFVLSGTNSTGSSPYSVAAADVNGDGMFDLISANYLDHSLTVLTNNGSGGFRLAGTYVVGSGPNSVTAADVNGDGKIDLISANISTNSLTVLTNDGSGGFMLAGTYVLGTIQTSVAVADVNGDAKTDLISVNSDGNSLIVLTNNGSGGFRFAGTYSVGNYPYSVAATDVNGDGKTDLINANYYDNSLTVLTNNGSGGFVLAGTYSVGTNPCSVAVADVNGDGKIDLISANINGNSLTVLTNDGSGGFGLAGTYPVGSWPLLVAAADVNGDGKIDLISSTGSSGGTSSLTVLTNATSFPSSSMPILVSQPLGHTNIFGNAVSFTVLATATGIEPARQFSYQWQMAGTNLPGATNNSLILTNLTLSQSGNYDVVVSNYVGSVTSSVAALNVQFILVRVNGQPAIGSGTAVASGQVTISGGYPGGFLFYTLNGSTPTTASTLYSGPFTVTNTTVVNVMAMSADFSQNTLAPPVTVQIVPVYTLGVSVSGSGTVGLNPASGPYPSNSVVTLTATAATNWVFNQWTGGISATNNPYNLTINGSLNVQAVFTPTAYPLTVSTAGGGSVMVNGQTIAAATYFPTNSTVSITATASNGWSFLNWQGDASGTNNPLNVTISQTNNIQAVFGTVVNTNVIGGGGVVLNVTNPVPYGTLLTASAVPAAGNYLVAWSSAASGTNSPTTILVTNATPTAGAIFAALPGGKYSLAVVVSGLGSVAISNQQSYYNPGSVVRLTATTTNAGTGFDGWSGNASGTNQTIVLTVNSNLIVQANFGKPLAVITLGNLVQTFDGAAKSVSVTTIPTNLAVNLTYNGTANAPTNVGSYTVVATISDANYQGGVTNTLVINPQIIGQVSFVLSSSPGVGNGPESVAAADVNGDGKIDLISANTDGNSLTVLTNNGSSGFVPAGNYSVGFFPTSIAVADVNGDGKTDLISANFSGNSLTVLTNDGSGRFGVAGTYSVGNNPVSVAVADVNGDGKTDLISADSGFSGAGETLTVLTNNGAGGFVVAGTYSVGNAPYSVAVADLNGDGKIDLISANLSGNSLTVLTNNGSGGFVLAGTYSVGNTPYSATASDVNGDGKIDLISANYAGNSLTVLTNNGSGGFVLAGTYFVGSPRSVSTADINGDGEIDLISANTLANSFTILTNATTFPPSSLPILTLQPLGQTNYFGRVASFTVAATATGIEPARQFSYQWQMAGTNLPGATNNSLILPNLSLSQSGNYDVVVSNYVGSVTSSVAVLNVQPAPATITLSNLIQTFDGNAKSPSVTTVPTNLTVNLTYNGSPNAPTNAGSYTVVGTISDPNYTGSLTNTLVINQATPVIGTLPTASTITYGQTLANSTLSGGAASTAGSFAFTTPTIAPNAGTTNVPVTFTPTDTNNYTTTNALVAVSVNQALATVTLTSLNQTYNGTAKPVSAATSPLGLNVGLTYNGFSFAPTNAGSYVVVATINSTNYFGSATNTLVIGQATATVAIGSLNQTYNGAAKPVSVTTSPLGLNVNLTYEGLAIVPTNAGSYIVVATVTNLNYAGSATNTLLVAKAAGLVNLSNLVQTFDGTAKSITATTVPTNLTVNLTYNGIANAPTNVGSYAVAGTISDTNYQGSVTNILAINPATPTITTSPTASAITYGQTLANSTLNGGAASTAGSFSFTTPTIAPNAGTTNVPVTFKPTDTNNYTTATINVLVPVNQAVATVTIGNLSQTYTGTARPVSVTTIPANLSVTLTYNGLPVAPTNVGNYTVSATVNDLNYVGSSGNILTVNKATGLLTLTNLVQTFDGTAKSVGVTTVPASLTVNLTYNGTANAPTNAGSYTVVGTILDTSYQGSVTNTLSINPALPTITTLPTASAITYGQTLTNSTLSGGAASTAGSFAFTTPTIAPNAGTTNVPVTFTPTDAIDYTTTNAKVLVVVNQALATVTLTNLNQTYNGTARPVSVVTSPIGLNASLTYNGLSFAPTNAGSYVVVATVTNLNYSGSATNTLVIGQAPAIVTISNLTQFYNGTPKPVATATIPTNLTVNVTYNGSNGVPSAIGSYTVVAAVNDANYFGSATNTLAIIPVPPFVISQPTNQNLAVGSPATFNVSASGTAPLGYQWLKNNLPLTDNGFISGSTTSNLTLSAVSKNDAGSYSVVITNLAGSVTSSNASLAVNAAVYVVSTNAVSGGTVSVPIKLKALGQEISLQFSISFNPLILTYQGVDNLSVIVTTNSPLPGQIGLTFQNFAGYSPGDQLLVNVVFAAQPVITNTVSPVNFADVPVGRQVIDGSFNVLTNVIYTGGSVTVVPAEYAADVFPRFTGDSTVDLRDWAQLGRFVTALDLVSSADEMLRADCAPRSNPDGVLTVADWVQAGRYAAKLDPLTVVSSNGIPPQIKTLARINPLASSPRSLELTGSNATNGQIVTVPVNLVASGTENALGFNVAFDASQLTLLGITKGVAAGSAVMNVNTNQSATGRLGVTVALNSGNTFAGGTNQIALLSFLVSGSASGNVPVAFAATNPVVQQVCDVNAGVLPTSYVSAIITLPPGSKPVLQIQLTNGSVKLTWPQMFSNYSLQSISNLGATGWLSNLGTPSVVGTNFMVLQPATNRVQFFRLSQ